MAQCSKENKIFVKKEEKFLGKQLYNYHIFEIKINRFIQLRNALVQWFNARTHNTGAMSSNPVRFAIKTTLA